MSWCGSFVATNNCALKIKTFGFSTPQKQIKHLSKILAESFRAISSKTHRGSDVLLCSPHLCLKSASESGCRLERRHESACSDGRKVSAQLDAGGRTPTGKRYWIFCIKKNRNLQPYFLNCQHRVQKKPFHLGWMVLCWPLEDKMETDKHPTGK